MNISIKSPILEAKGGKNKAISLWQKNVDKSSEKNILEESGYGRCADCSCPGFQGNGYTCTRGGCKHHYDRHW